MERKLRTTDPLNEAFFNTFTYPGRQNEGFHGIMNCKYAFEHYIKYGPNEWKEVIDKHIFVSIDPGVINTAGAVVISAEAKICDKKASITGEFVPLKLKT